MYPSFFILACNVRFLTHDATFLDERAYVVDTIKGKNVNFFVNLQPQALLVNHYSPNCSSPPLVLFSHSKPQNPNPTKLLLKPHINFFFSVVPLCSRYGFPKFLPKISPNSLKHQIAILTQKRKYNIKTLTFLYLVEFYFPQIL